MKTVRCLPTELLMQRFLLRLIKALEGVGRVWQILPEEENGDFWSLCLEGEEEGGMQAYKTSLDTSDTKSLVRDVLFMSFWHIDAHTDKINH